MDKTANSLAGQLGVVQVYTFHFEEARNDRVSILFRFLFKMVNESDLWGFVCGVLAGV